MAVAESISCHLCTKQSASHQMMLWHLACQHFKVQLMEKHQLNKFSRTCPICEKPTKLISGLIIHLAQAHEQLKGLVDSKVLENLSKNLKKAKVSCLLQITTLTQFGRFEISQMCIESFMIEPPDCLNYKRSRLMLSHWRVPFTIDY